MIKEVRAKTIVSRVKGIDTYFGLDYGMNLYRGCQHRCIYCDSRSECYGIEQFDRDVLVKVNAIDLLRDELPRKRRKGIIGTGSMNDPYMPLEEKLNLTQRALEVIAEQGFGVHVTTKSDLVLRDVLILKRIAHVGAAVSFTITTIDDELAKKVEPFSAPPSARFRALERLAGEGIEARIALMPTLPFLEDNWENVSAIVERAHACGVAVIVPWFGMSLRDRQRAYFYHRLDELFPGIRAKYEAAYGNDYMCPSPDAKELSQRFTQLCASYGIATVVQPHLAPTAEQLPLL
jgi:DNA repair photolyase